MGSIAIDLSGQRFGRLAVLSRGPNIRKESGWNCMCDCGRATFVRGYNLRQGLTKSCGCYNREVTTALRKSEKTHGMSSSPIYRSWRSMIDRCENPRSPDYKRYGGRGISVCRRWRKSFENFYADMGDRPSNKTIDRLDLDKGYEPANCRWATRKEQANNKRSCVLICCFGRTQNVAQWAEELGVSHSTILNRLRRGWPPERILRPLDSAG